MTATIASAYQNGQFGLSFELFPPKTEVGEQSLREHVARLVEFKPAYLTCTYGAGGSTQGKTLDIVARVNRDHGLPVATHLTCVGLTADQIASYLREANARGVTSVVALRGDPPHGQSHFTFTDGGFRYANELVEFIRARFPHMGIAVGGYPETHQEATSPEADLVNLKRKVDAGSDVVITQLFYDNRDFWRFRDKCDALGIAVPIVPGILPVTNFPQIQRISNLCGAALPEGLVSAMQAAGDDAAAQFRVGVDFATQQVGALLAGGLPGLHLYVLNKSEAAAALLSQVTLPE